MSDDPRRADRSPDRRRRRAAGRGGGAAIAALSMTSPRTCSQTMSHADAVAELRRCAGSGFDAAVVAAFAHAYERQEAAPAATLLLASNRRRASRPAGRRHRYGPAADL